MTTVITVFILALLFSLVLTPLAKYIGIRFGAVDLPDERKVHLTEIPRIGGIAIFVSFLVSILIIKQVVFTNITAKFTLDSKAAALFIGAVIVFGIGVIDDFKRLGPGVKVVFQILAASIAYWGGLKIKTIGIQSIQISFGVISYFVTVFWFLLFINAINLIDGLDGLAAGVALFCSCIMVFLSMIRKDYWSAVVFASLSGSILGFLRYNFNPASIFMGDGGSYFIGFAIAGLSILSSVKSQVSAGILIPLIALGVPVFDAIFAPIRRFIVGKGLFQPDRGHLHHRLIEKGLSAKKAVMILYGITAVFCFLAIGIVNYRSEQAGFVLIIVGASMIILIQKVGYLEYFAADKLYGWFKDISDEVGITQSRRSFLNLQMEMMRAKDMNDLWKSICAALEILKFDMAEMQVTPIPTPHGGGTENSFNRACSLKDQSGSEDTDSGSLQWRYEKKGFFLAQDICKKCMMKLELPLLDSDQTQYGTIWLVKDLSRDPVSHYTLRRVEHLRRSIVSSLKQLADKGQHTKQ